MDLDPRLIGAILFVIVAIITVYVAIVAKSYRD